MPPVGRRSVLLSLLGPAFWPAKSVVRASAVGGSPAQAVHVYGTDVGLVRLSVTARTSTGGLVHDLTAEEFQVLEDGVEQQVVRFGHHEAPISVVVLFDKSGSMQEEQKLMHAKDGVANFVRALRPQDEVLVVAFSQTIDVLGDFGLDARTITAATEGIEAESTTRLYDAVLEGARAISSPGRKEKRALLILSDGEDNTSRSTLEGAVEAVRAAGVPVYAIGIEIGDEGQAWRDLAPRPFGDRYEPPLEPDSLWKRLDPEPNPKAATGPATAIRALVRLTEGTGGWTYPVVAAKRCKDVCVRIAEELRNQYLLGYSPENAAADGRWRVLTVRTTRPGVRLSTRSGYFAPAP